MKKRMIHQVIVLIAVIGLGIAEAQTPGAPPTRNQAIANVHSEIEFSKLMSQTRPPRHVGFSLMSACSLAPMAGGAQLPVVGSGTIGRLAKWTGFTSSNSAIGDTSIFEDKFGNVGIGTDAPASKLTVRGIIETTLGGLKFPDGTVQTTAAVSGLQAVFHDATLTGNGTAATPLGVAVPLILNGEISATQYDIAGSRVLSVSGENNLFVGINAGVNNTDGSDNSFFGHQAGGSNTSGFGNSFLGSQAGNANTFGSANSFFGQSAGRLTTSGSNNSFFGSLAGDANDAGTGNTFVGGAAGFHNTTGNDNSFFGFQAGSNKASGFGNTIIGFGANVASGDLNHATAIGFGALVSASDTIALGRSTGDDTVIVPGKLTVGTLGSAGSTQLCLNASNQIANCSSSLRYKTDLRPFTAGLSIINRLQSISFTWKEGGLRDLGLGAEEVQKIEPLLVTLNAQGQVEGVKYERVAVVLVNAIKDQQLQIAAQQTQIEELKSIRAENATLKGRLAEVLTRLEQLEKTRAAQK
jgi:hypothetical protein